MEIPVTVNGASTVAGSDNHFRKRRKRSWYSGAGRFRLAAAVGRGPHQERFPDAKVLVFSTYAGDVQVLHAMKAGARGYLLKGNVRTELLDAIRTVHAGRKRIPPEIAAELAEHAADDQLTSREIDVLRLIGAGNANKLIADKLGIRETTVKNHISRIISNWARTIALMPLSWRYHAGSSNSRPPEVGLINPTFYPFGRFQIPNTIRRGPKGPVCNVSFPTSPKAGLAAVFYSSAC